MGQNDGVEKLPTASRLARTTAQQLVRLRRDLSTETRARWSYQQVLERAVNDLFLTICQPKMTDDGQSKQP